MIKINWNKGQHNPYFLIDESLQQIWLGVSAKQGVGFYSYFGHGVFSGFMSFILNNPKYSTYKINFIESPEWTGVWKDSNEESLIESLYNKDIILTTELQHILYDKQLKFPLWLHHELYSNKAIKYASKFFKHLFEINSNQQKEVSSIISKLSLDLEKTLAIWIRATDKQIEVKTNSPEEWISQAYAVASKTNPKKIFLQTDHKAYLNAFIKEFGDTCVYISDIPVSEGTQLYITKGTDNPRYLVQNPAHWIKQNRLQFIKNISVAVNLASQCKFLITHTGNLACAISLYRGNSGNVWQCNNKGNFVDLTVYD